MKDTNRRKIELKIIDAVKGFLNNCHLQPPSEELVTRGYAPNWHMLQSDSGAWFQLLQKHRDQDRIFYLVEELYPDQTARSAVNRLLTDAASEWIRGNHSISDQARIEELAREFLEGVASEIEDRILYVPLQGIKGTITDPLKLGYCELYSNGRDSEMQMLLKNSEEALEAKESTLPSVYSKAKKAPFFCREAISAHRKKAFAIAEEHAELGLNILRLIFASYYWDRHRQTAPRRMGLVGT